MRLFQLAFVELIWHDADSPQVVRRLRAAFGVLGPRPGDAAAAVPAVHALLDTYAGEVTPPKRSAR